MMIYGPSNTVSTSSTLALLFGLCILSPIILSTIKVVLAPLFWHVLLILFLISIVRPASDDELFMSRNLIRRLRPTQIYLDRLVWIDSDVDLNCSGTKFKMRKMLISVKLPTKYDVMIIYML